MAGRIAWTVERGNGSGVTYATLSDPFWVNDVALALQLSRESDAVAMRDWVAETEGAEPANYRVAELHYGEGE